MSQRQGEEFGAGQAEVEEEQAVDGVDEVALFRSLDVTTEHLSEQSQFKDHQNALHRIPFRVALLGFKRRKKNRIGEEMK